MPTEAKVRRLERKQNPNSRPHRPCAGSVNQVRQLVNAANSCDNNLILKSIYFIDRSKMSFTECYRTDTTTPAYSLRWSWTGWPSKCTFPTIGDHEWQSLSEAWEQDGIRILERKCESEYWQATVSTKPNVVPCFIVARIKGRIDHQFRSQKTQFKFSRKVSLRSLGNNTVNDVQDYIRKQVDTALFCDADYAASLKQFTRVWDAHESQSPIEVASGRYWYQLHLVLVIEARHRIRDMNAVRS